MEPNTKNSRSLTHRTQGRENQPAARRPVLAPPTFSLLFPHSTLQARTAPNGRNPRIVGLASLLGEREKGRVWRNDEVWRRDEKKAEKGYSKRRPWKPGPVKRPTWSRGMGTRCHSRHYVGMRLAVARFGSGR